MKLDHIYELNDERLSVITDSCPNIEQLSVTNCGVKQPNVGNLDRISRIDFSYCADLCGIDFTHNVHLLTSLGLSGTIIQDAQLELLCAQLPCLKRLALKSCKLLKQPIIRHGEVEHLDMSFCSKLTKPELVCPRLKHLDLSFTRIKDAALAAGLLQQPTMFTIQVLNLSNNTKLKSLKIIDTCKTNEVNLALLDKSSGDIDKATSIDQLQALIQETADQDHFAQAYLLEKLYLDGCSQLGSAGAVVDIRCANSLLELDLRITPVGMNHTAVKEIFLFNPMLKKLRYNRTNTQFGDMVVDSASDIEKVLQ